MRLGTKVSRNISTYTIVNLCIDLSALGGYSMLTKNKKTKLMTYSSSLAMGRQRYASRNQNTTSFRTRERRIGPVSNTIMLVLLACLLGLLYLTQVTKTNAYGYQINSLQQKQSQLVDEHAQLEVAQARLESLERIKNSTVAASLTTLSPSGTVAR